ncbi:MAG: hypothetical protein ACK4JY_09230 [Brevundimonas sp.]|uniref:hypothetical protein n=1 Tax=Brevundimonas sp. TaxID=1871086 RepID=UPI00391DFD6A
MINNSEIDVGVVNLRPLEDILNDHQYRGQLKYLVNENRSLLYLVPGNGNYAGNGSNDAWIKWEAYARAKLGFQGLLGRNAEGEAQIQRWLDEYFDLYPNSDPFDLKPENRGDWAAFFHDIKSWGGVLRDVAGNLVFSYQSVLSFLESHDPYELLAAPFISFFGSAANVVSELVEAGGDFFGGFTSGFQDFFSGTQMAVQNLWQGDFFGAASSFFSGIGNAISHFIDGIGDAFMHLFPVVLDLDQDGIELLTNTEAANVRLFEADGEHYIQGGWVAPDDGLVGIDLNRNGLIDSMDEFVFTRLDPNAASDLEALRVLDTNGDGVLDMNDAEFERLMLWQDRDVDGWCDESEAITLTEAGINSLSLSLDNRVSQKVKGHDVLHLSTFQWADGRIGVAGDVAFIVPAEVHSIHEATAPRYNWRADPHGELLDSLVRVEMLHDWALVA